MTLKLFKSGIHTTMGVAAVIALVMASGVIDSDETPVAGQPDAENTAASKKASSSRIQTKLPKDSVDSESSPEESVPSVSTPEPLKIRGDATTRTDRPQFDVLRVEKDGAVVVAGNAMPNSLVDIVRPDGTIVGQAQTGSQGDFALALKNVLLPGNHVLGLRSTDADGVKLQSVQTGVIRIPEKEGDVLAMVSQDGELSRFLMKPVSFQPQETPTLKRENLSSTSPDALTSSSTGGKPVLTTQDKPALQHPVLVEAVEVEGQRVFVAGAVMKGELVRVYLDNVSIGTARGTQDNRFLLSKKFKLQPGTHAVRVDVINEKTGGVRSRAEVGLQHDLPEEAFAIKTNKFAEFADHSKNQQTGVEVAGLEIKSGKPVSTDGVIPNSTPKRPINPLLSEKSDTPLISGAKNGSSELLLAHVINRSTIDTTKDEQTGPKFITTGRAIIIKPGDSLWRISQLTYGDGMRYTTIFNANRNQIRDPNLIYAGQILEIPEKVVQ